MLRFHQQPAGTLSSCPVAVHSGLGQCEYRVVGLNRTAVKQDPALGVTTLTRLVRVFGIGRGDYGEFC